MESCQYGLSRSYLSEDADAPQSVAARTKPTSKRMRFMGITATREVRHDRYDRRFAARAKGSGYGFKDDVCTIPEHVVRSVTDAGGENVDPRLFPSAQQG